jgi:uncharacterized membrane protein (DUF485 family)
VGAPKLEFASHRLTQTTPDELRVKSDPPGRDRMRQLTPERIQEILADPTFKELASERAKLRWGLSLVTLAMFFGFIGLISTAGVALGENLPGSAIPVGLLLGLVMIALVVLLTGLYVRQSNSRFDELARTVNREFAQ